MKAKIVRFLQQMLGLIPSKNPIGVPQFEAFVNSVFSLYNVPDLPSYKSALAAMILQDKRLYRSKYSFALAIRKAQANETAYGVMQEIRKQEKAAAPAPSTEAASGSQT